MELKNFFVQDLAGNAIPGAIGRLYDEGTTTLAGGLEDKDGNPQGNPMQSNQIGQLQFAAPDGRYDLYISSAARNYTIRVSFQEPGNLDFRAELASENGASLVGYEAGTVADALEASALSIKAITESSIDQRSMLKRKKVADLPMVGARHAEIIALYGYAYLYPQGIAIDLASDIIIINYGPSGGSNTWAWLYTYRLSTGALLSVVTTEVGINESMVIRYENGATYSDQPFSGATRYLYASADYNIAFGGASNLAKINITGIESKGFMTSIASSVAFPYAASVQAFSFIGWTGQEWVVQRLTASMGTRRRNLFERWNNDFSAYVGGFSTPFNFTGQITGTYYPTSPKAQGFAVCNGKLFTAIGAPFSTLSGSPANNNPLLPGKMYGIATVGPDGTGLQSSLCQANKFMEALAPHLDYTATQIEAEGMCSNSGNLYTMFITLGASTGVPETRGLVIFEELSADSDAIDFQNYASVNRGIFNELDFRTRLHQNAAKQLSNPITGDSLTTYAQICAMMAGLDLSTYSFIGNGQALTDILGVVVTPTTNRTFKFTSIDGNRFSLEVYGDAAYERFTIDLAAVTQTRAGWSTGIDPAAFPINAGYVAHNAASLGRTKTFRNANVSVPHYEFYNLDAGLTTKQLVGSISTSGSATTYATSSDYRLKKNIRDLDGSGEFIDSLRPRTFDMDGTEQDGFVAHELQEVSPMSVTGEKDGVDEDGNPAYQGIQASTPEIIANLVAEIQSLRKRITAIEDPK